MGVAVGDYDGDGRMDLFVTTFADDNYILFHNDGDGFFSDVSYPSGVGEATIPNLGWATSFLDYDNDGIPDLFCANGHVYPEVDGVLKQTFRQPLQFFRGLGDGKFAEMPSAFASIPRISARGGAVADVDNDGDLDIAVSVMDSRPLLLENRGGNRLNWLRVSLRGVRSNRSGVGARVKVTAAGRTQYETLHAGESYLSSNDPRLHFGLGSVNEAQVEIVWPSGRLQKVGAVKANKELFLTEPEKD